MNLKIKRTFLALRWPVFVLSITTATTSGIVNIRELASELPKWLFQKACNARNALDTWWTCRRSGSSVLRQLGPSDILVTDSVQDQHNLLHGIL